METIQWPKVGYKALTCEAIPCITEALLNAYFIRHGRKEGVKEVQAVGKGIKLLDGECAEACSVLIWREQYFFSGMVRAEMKKHTKYWCKLNCNERGEIINSECECPSGAGPHATCKHLACMSLLLVHYSQTGELRIRQSCTEQLQTFHHPTTASTSSGRICIAGIGQLG